MAAPGFYIPAISQHVRLLHWWRFNDQVGICRWDCRVAAVSGGGLNLDQIAAQVFAITSTAALDVIPASAQFDGVTAEVLVPTPPPPGHFPNVAAAYLGTFSVLTDPIAQQQCGIIKKYTGVAGVAFRGRMYIPFPSYFAMDPANSDKPTAFYLGKLNALALALLSIHTLTVGAASIILNPVIVHGPPRAGTDDFVTGAEASALFGTQRRRSQYGRPNPPPSW